MTRCWCGVDNPYYAPLERYCGGMGLIECICGGEFCICHHHGVVECSGCSECEPTEIIEEDDLYCHEDHGHATTQSSAPATGPPPDGRRAASDFRSRGRNSDT